MRKQTDAAEIASLRARLTTAEQERDALKEALRPAFETTEAALDSLARCATAEACAEAAEHGMTEVSTANIVLTEQRNMAQAEARGYAEDLARAQIALRFIVAHPNGVGDHHPAFVARAALACPPQQRGEK